MLLAALPACGTSSIELDVILPRDGESLLAEATCYRLTGTRGGRSTEDVGSSATGLRLDGLTAGTYDLTLEAVEHPQDEGACTGGDVRARASTRGVRLDIDRTERVPLLLLPLNQPVALESPASIEDWFEGRTELAAAVAVDRAGVPRVVFAGGRTADGRPSAEVTLYEPRRARFSALPDLHCARAGAAAVAIGAPGEDDRIVVAGGDGDCETRLCEDADPPDAACSAEVVDPTGGGSVVSPLAVPVERPRAVRHGATAWLLGSSSDRAILQSFSGEDWGRDRREDMNLPHTGGAFTPILPDGSPPFLVAGGRAGAELMQTMALLRPEDDRLVPCPITGPTARVAGENVVAAPTQNGRVVFGGLAADLGASWVEQRFDETACAPLAGVTSGALAAPRSDGLTTPLPGGQVLFSGGDADGTLELFLPYEKGTLPLGPGAGPRHGHVAVPLEDGSVMLAGGGPRDVDVLLPRTAAPGNLLRWDHVAEPEPAVDIVVVASSHREARDVRQMLVHGGTFRRADEEGGVRFGFEVGGDPAGLTAAISPFAGFEFAGVKNIRVVITTGDMRCEGGHVGDGGLPRVCSDPEVTDPDLLIECALGEIVEADACLGQELLRATEAAVVSESLTPSTGRPLLVLIASARDDCSADEAGAVFEAGGAPLAERCATGQGLLDPAAVAEELARLRGGDPALISVMTFGGPDQAPAGAPVEACPGVYPTPRLAGLSAAMGERGLHVNLCERGPAHPALTSWSQLVEGRIGRRVCLPHRPTEPSSCLVTYDRDLAEGLHERVRVPAGDEGWSVSSSSCDYGSLVISPRLVLPIGEDVFYACQ